MAEKQEKKPARGQEKSKDKKANRRGAARLAAVQALYQMDIAAAGLNDIFAEFEGHWLGGEVEGDKYLPAEAAFFKDVVAGVVRDQGKLDPLIDDALSKGWPLKRIDAILRAVLRAGSYELEHRKDVPARVVVSEYVDVANAFVDKDETGMVTAVLDQLARQFRAGEFERAARGSALSVLTPVAQAGVFPGPAVGSVDQHVRSKRCRQPTLR